MSTGIEGIARADKPGIGKTPHDHRLLPTGRTIGETRDVTSITVKAGIPGASNDRGRLHNIEAFVAEADRQRADAADKRERAWLAELGAKA